MPNWVSNNLVVTKKVYEAIKTEWTDAFGKIRNSISFNTIIPEPETMEECMEKFGKEYIIEGKCSPRMQR